MGEQEKITPKVETTDVSKKIPSKEDYLKQALENLQLTSRTAKGVVDISASLDKAREIQSVSGQEASDRTIANFKEVIEQLYEQRNRPFENPDELKIFIEAVTRRINKGIIKENTLVRSHDSDKYPYTKVENLSQEMKQFYEELFARLQDPSHDPERLAGWIEYRIDLTDHFFADGCGKTAKAISAWALMRSHHRLPRYRDRKELYQHAPTQIRGTNPEANQKEFGLWMEYYTSLFEPNEETKNVL